MVDRHHDLIGVEAEQAGGVFQGVDGGAVDVGLACFPQAAVADVGAESAEQAGQGGRPAVHGRGLHHLGGEEAAPGHASQLAWPMWARLAAQARVVGWSEPRAALSAGSAWESSPSASSGRPSSARSTARLLVSVATSSLSAPSTRSLMDRARR